MAKIRAFRSDDLDALCGVCLATAASGNDAAARYRDPKLVGRVYVAPYGLLSPEAVFVVEDESGVGGYIAGAPDTSDFEARTETEWWPSLRTLYRDPSNRPRADWSPDELMSYRIHHPGRTPGQILEAYPSHLHINLLPHLRGRGFGRGLMERWLQTVRDMGSCGAHLAVGRANLRAIRFYRASGFREIGQPPPGSSRPLWFGIPLMRRGTVRGVAMPTRARVYSLFLGLLFLSVHAAVALAAAAPAENTSAAATPVEITFTSGELLLHGFLYKPEGNGPFRAVIWDHGSEPKPGWLPGVAPLFVARGYVFFIPHRRGQGRSPGAYILDLLNRELAQHGAEAWSRRLAELMEAHLQDQIAAPNYLKTLAYLDAQKIAVAGCSFGGVQTILAAGETLGLRAAVDFAGAAQVWSRSPEMRERMLTAAHRATVPILLIQAENDYDLAPSRALDEELRQAGKPHKIDIFPPFGNTHQDGHGFCARGAEIWAPTVFSFLDEAMK